MNSRNIYVDTPLKLGHITQGSIFSGALSDNYQNCEVFGVVITARCSIANKKLTTYHYLPIVNYEDWLDREFRSILLESSIKEYKNKLKSFLSQNGQSPNIVEQFGYKEIRDTIISHINSNKSRDNLNDIIKKLIELESQSISINKIISINSKGADALLKRLTSNDLAEYYLLEGWDGIRGSHHIILLNEIKRLRKDVFFRIGEGITFETSSGINFEGSDVANIELEDICYVQAQIKSPFVEHILQRFYYNFGRIGVEDMNQETTLVNLKNKWL